VPGTIRKYGNIKSRGRFSCFHSNLGKISLFTLKDDKDLQFGDYTTRLRGEVLNGFNMNLSYLKVFYTTETDYWIAKSKLIRDGGEYTFHEVCQDLIDRDFYPGADFLNKKDSPK
jgi:hypothetical protein